MYVAWEPRGTLDALKKLIDSSLANYREEYARVLRVAARPGLARARDANPTVVLIPGVGHVHLRQEQDRVANHRRVLRERHSRDGRRSALPAETESQCKRLSAGRPSGSADHVFRSIHNYVALPLSEAFRIEYWELEEAKIRRQPPEKELSRQIALIVGGGSGIGREVALLAAAARRARRRRRSRLKGANAVARRDDRQSRAKKPQRPTHRHPQSRDDPRRPRADGQPVRRRRHSRQYRRHCSPFARWNHHGRTVGADARR